jgi:hypothetical protein
VAERLENRDEILLTATFSNQELESVLEEMKLVLNLDYSISDGRVILSKSE